jgi:hypothetical protein
MTDPEGPTFHERRLDDGRAVPRRRIGVRVVVRSCLRVADLWRCVEEIAGEHQGVIPIVDPNDSMPRRMTWRVEQVEASSHVMVTSREVEETSVLDERHGEPSGEVVR